jgi:hypothetical protein
MVVVRRNTGGAYILSELDGAVAIEPYAAFRLIPYYSRSDVIIPVTRMIEKHKKLIDAGYGPRDIADDGLREWEGQSEPMN